jgi:allophanate hydrolase subunit 1
VHTIGSLETDLQAIMSKNKALTAELDSMAEQCEAEVAQAVSQAQAQAQVWEAPQAVQSSEPSEQMVELEQIYSTLDLQYKRLKLQYNTLNEQNEAYVRQIEELDGDK